MPEYNRRFRSGLLMGPTAFGGNATNPFKVLAPYGDSISYAFELLGVHEVLPNFEEFRRYLAHTTCHLSNLHSAACKNVYALFLGVPPAKVNLTMAPTYMGHSPSGGSITQFKHYAQIAANGGKFRSWGFFWDACKFWKGRQVLSLTGRQTDASCKAPVMGQVQLRGFFRDSC